MPETPHSSSGDWLWTQTPDPASPIFTIYVATQNITLTNKPVREVLAFGSTPYAAPTAFKNLDASFNMAHLNTLGVSDWQFIGETIQGAVTAFHFFKNQTLAQQLVPYDVQEVEGNHHWDEVVLNVWPEEDDSVTQSYNVIKNGSTGIRTAPEVRIRAETIPSTDTGSRIITRKFLSATRPVIPRHRTPQPMELDIQVNGKQRIFSRCLHDDLSFEDTRSGTSELMNGAGMSTALGGTVPGVFYPATNFTTRKPFFVSDLPVRNQYGLWERDQIEVRPPKIESIIT